MDNSTTAEIEEPPPLEKLADSLAPVKDINHSARVKANGYDQSVSIILMFKAFRQPKGFGGYEIFRVYDPEKPVSERHVGDNKSFIADSMGHPGCYMQIRKFLESLGYRHFHNSLADYTEKRFREHLAKNSQ